MPHHDSTEFPEPECSTGGWFAYTNWRLEDSGLLIAHDSRTGQDVEFGGIVSLLSALATRAKNAEARCCYDLGAGHVAGRHRHPIVSQEGSNG